MEQDVTPCSTCDAALKFAEAATFTSLEQIAYFLTQEAVHLLVHFKFLRVYGKTSLVESVYSMGFLH